MTDEQKSPRSAGSEPSEPLKAGTLRMLLALAIQESNTAAGAIDGAYLLAYVGGPSTAGFALGDDITMGEGEFGDGGENYAEFHHTDGLVTGLWVAEWDWEMKYNEEWDLMDLAYGKERWSRPTLADLVAFDMLPAEANHV